MKIKSMFVMAEKLDELEAKLQVAQERIDSESAFHKEAARLLTIEQSKLKVAVEALEFYGDKENWQAPEDQGFEHHDTLDNSLADMIHEDHDKKTGGKRARQALAAIKDA